MAAMLVVCDHLDSDTNELTFPRFGRKKYGVNDPRQIRFANVATSFVAGTHSSFISFIEATEFKDM